VASGSRTRLTAGERREHVLAAAVAEFAVTGYHGTPTEAIAKRAGISQPYLFRLYRTKKDLFLACVDRCFDRVTETFRTAAEAAPEGDREAAMGRAYVEMLADRELLLFQLQTYAAADDADVRAVARRRYEGVIDTVAQLGAVGRNEALRFISQGMLLNVAAALELDPERVIWHDDEAADE
jgi:AcrR family transcriptional regulator